MNPKIGENSITKKKKKLRLEDQLQEWMAHPLDCHPLRLGERPRCAHQRRAYPNQLH